LILPSESIEIAPSGLGLGLGLAYEVYEVYEVYVSG
jgi:hypothetical protein